MKRLMLFVIALALMSTRALAQGGTIGGGGGGSITYPLLAPDGSQAAPSYSFANSTGTGLYYPGGSLLRIVTAGTVRAVFGTTANFSGSSQVYAADGAAATPGYSFNSGTALGMYRVGADTLGFAAAGRLAMAVRDSQMLAQRGRTDKPAYSFFSDWTTGMSLSTVDTLTFSSGGTTVLRMTSSPKIIGGASSMTVLAGTGNSRNMLLQTTNGSGTATTFLTAKFDTVRIHDEVVLPALTAASGTPNSVCMNATSKQITENAATSCVVSSRRFKENIAPLTYESALGIVSRLGPSTFTYREGKRRALGLIAEDVVRVDPRLVTYDGKGQINSVNYEQVTIALLAVVQQQQQDIDQLHTVLLGLLGAGGAAGAGLAGWRKRKVT